MKPLFSLVFLVFIATTTVAQDSIQEPVAPLILDGTTANLNEFLWIKRPLIVFADTPADPRYVEQMGYITERLDMLDERDVVVLTDTDPAARSELRKALRPRGFSLVLVGKDGAIYLRKPAPWRVREITRSIDKLPVRQQELRDHSNGS
ncbi:MAG: DUF4174 domain-containing protein [Roseovarius sp.]|nr:DUF4174 domain-containing protein [Roseovarius sp.]